MCDDSPVKHFRGKSYTARTSIFDLKHLPCDIYLQPLDCLHVFAITWFAKGKGLLKFTLWLAGGGGREGVQNICAARDAPTCRKNYNKKKPRLQKLLGERAESLLKAPLRTPPPNELNPEFGARKFAAEQTI